MEEVKSRQAALAQLQRLEVAVAARAGLGMLYCTPGLQLQPTYTRFLERLAAFASDQGPCGCVPLFSPTFSPDASLSRSEAPLDSPLRDPFGTYPQSCLA